MARKSSNSAKTGTPPAAARKPAAHGTAPAAKASPQYANRMVWWPRWVRLFRQEPALAITLSYLVVGLVGLWSSYWYYGAFGIPVLEYYQISDFLISGLRDPFNFLALLAMLLVGVVSYSPTWFDIHYPQKVARWRKHPLGRLWFSDYASSRRLRRWYDVPPELVLMAGMLLGGGSLMVSHAIGKAERIQRGGGTPLAITLAGDGRPLQGEARLIGTSTSHVFLHWPSNGRTEVLSAESVARMERLPRRQLVTPR